MAQAFPAQLFKGCEQHVSGSRWVWKWHAGAAREAAESLPAGRCSCRLPPVRPTAIGWFLLLVALQQGNPKFRFLKIPLLIFMEAHTMKLNSSQRNRAPETGWSFLWGSSLWWANLEEIHSEYDFFLSYSTNKLNHLLTLISYRNRLFKDSLLLWI